MNIENILDWIKAIGSLSSAAALVWAIYVYKRRERDALNEALKEKISEFVASVSQIDSILSSKMFASFGHDISQRINQIFRNADTPDELISCLLEDKHSAAIKGAVDSVIGESRAKERVDQIVTNVQSIPYDRAVSDVPIIRDISYGLVILVKLSVGASYHQRTIVGNLTNKELWEAEEIRQQSEDKEVLIHGAMPALISDIMSHSLLGGFQKVLEQVEKILSILVLALSNMSSSEIEKLKKIPVIRIKDSEKNVPHIKHALSLLPEIREIFSKEDMDSLIKSQTIIEQSLAEYGGWED